MVMVNAVGSVSPNFKGLSSADLNQKHTPREELSVATAPISAQTIDRADQKKSRKGLYYTLGTIAVAAASVFAGKKGWLGFTKNQREAVKNFIEPKVTAAWKWIKEIPSKFKGTPETSAATKTEAPVKLT